MYTYFTNGASAHCSLFPEFIEYICTLSARNVLLHKPATVLSQFDSFTLFENFCSVFRRKTFKMTEERVQSKNLFNFRPQGFIDPEVVFYDEKMKKDFGLDPQAMEEEMKNQTEAEFVGGMREFMDGFLGNTPFATGPAYVEVTTLEHFIEICGPSENESWSICRRTLPAPTRCWRCQPSMTGSTASKCSCTLLK